MKLEDIGFYTLSDGRAQNVSVTSPLQRCELILTGACNFRCEYCRGLSQHAKGTLSLDQAKAVVKKWASHGLVNIRFSGGEPTLWPGLVELVKYTKSKGVKRVALSTNGSASPELYKELYGAGVNDFSVSLDACCAATGDMMAGKGGMWERVVNNIQMLSKVTYVTVGVVLDERNVPELPGIIQLAKDLGVSDIRIISTAQENKPLPVEDIQDDPRYPILKYRLNNIRHGLNVRGLKPTDSNRCRLVLDDMAIANGIHFPCIIYMREHGAPIGSADQSMEAIRAERERWALTHDTHTDPICQKNCLDVCIDYNNRCAAFAADRIARGAGPDSVHLRKVDGGVHQGPGSAVPDQVDSVGVR
ncbi:Coenzyme PQQ synthesis protein E [uncultured archaeon]|nr:Coenzyme PQQ synthesis protein E [uncultured archaeon]